MTDYEPAGRRLLRLTLRKQVPHRSSGSSPSPNPGQAAEQAAAAEAAAAGQPPVSPAEPTAAPTKPMGALSSIGLQVRVRG